MNYTCSKCLVSITTEQSNTFNNLCEECVKDIINNIVTKTPEAPEKDVDPINPSHYKKHPSGVECITVTQHFNFNRGNAIKYIWRAGEKNKLTECEDLKKAIWYLEQEINRIAGK